MTVSDIILEATKQLGIDTSQWFFSVFASNTINSDSLDISTELIH